MGKAYPIDSVRGKQDDRGGSRRRGRDLRSKNENLASKPGGAEGREEFFPSAEDGWDA